MFRERHHGHHASLPAEPSNGDADVRAPRSHKHSHSLRRNLLIGLILLGVLLVAGRLALPGIVKRYVNRQLDRTEGYSGSVGDIDIHLWRGAYSIHDLVIRKDDAGTNDPLFAVSRLDLSIQWKELFHGSLVGEVLMDQPNVNFVMGPEPEEHQTGADRAWDKTLESLFPFRLNKVEIREGRVEFQNPHSTPPVQLSLDQLTAAATNLTNARKVSDPLPAEVHATARTVGEGLLELRLRLNPMATAPTFELDCQVTNINMVALNDFLKAYGGFDVERGAFHLYTSVASKQGNYEGYLKVLFENLDVFQWNKDQKEDALGVFWEAIVGTLTTVFKNQPHDRLASKIPISGSFENTNVHLWTAVETLLRNAFIRALLPKLDERMTLGEVGGEPDNSGDSGDSGERTKDSREKSSRQRTAARDEATPESDRSERGPDEKPRPNQLKGAEQLMKLPAPAESSPAASPPQTNEPPKDNEPAKEPVKR